jgi:hypothetical protein
MRIIAMITIISSFLLANSAKTIVLKDGNKINGKVMSLQNGVYHIKTKSLGMIEIDEVQIDAIYNSNSSNTIQTQRIRRPRSSNINTSANLMNSASMMNSANKMNPALIQQMMSNPNYVKIINNPDIIKAVQGGDMSAIMQSEDFKTLMNSMSADDMQMIQNSFER